MSAGLVETTVQEYNLPFGTWDVPESRKIGKHMVEWQPVIHRQIIRGLMYPEVRLDEEGQEKLREQCQHYFCEEEGKYRILYVALGQKPERRRY